MSNIRYFLLCSRQGKVRLVRWYRAIDPKEKVKIMREVTASVLGRKQKMCNIVEYQDHKVVYKRYASLFFIAGISNEKDNELLTLEIIHRYVETMDRYFGNVRELDIIFNFLKAYSILDEMIMCDGSIVESCREDILHTVDAMDAIESNDDLDRILS